MNQNQKEKVLVLGAGISGINAGKLLTEVGRPVILYDGNKEKNEAELREQLGNPSDLTIVLGELTDEVLAQAGLCVISPGIPTDADFVMQVRTAGIPVWSEIELAYHYAKGRLIAITGTNGKTTTTALTGKICADYAESVFVVGNIGNAYTKEALKTKEESITVAEVSSFQLENIVNFHPQVSAVLNITPDHLNRHKTMECYTNVKLSIAKNQSPEDVVILNYEDDRLRAAAPEMMPRVLFFSSARELPEGAYLKGEEIFLALDGTVTRVCSIQDLNLLGRHNYENVMAAVLMAVSIGIPMDSIRHSLSEFRAVEHRIEFVEEKNGVAYYNDSKGTNVDAAIQAIRAMIRPTVLLGGGYDKGAEFDEWIQAFDGKVKQLILMGATARQIADTAAKYGVENIVFVDSMEEAVQTAAKTAEPGDAVLLSPACASWGMFPNYEVRGRVFKELVHAL
ncbi:UDP-N-acetylmuramoyl-L-alanine--D-glutamate ligase [Hominifimenecus microfluidus]|uniref:UDP-N-acetylmuramoylalanine--D-glutamate ligase n=1 Tax=Hominifimenecus microfluidus TaxID=2885348 RepID=A0AAE3E935_9FIRM|nr:UDP-N-acetylmuramoyl-L-alanine--D-glutamate ligase [Hominifimenecus microfluidus]MCC2230250.1 UDP-N-acetylmuramoyl-L-alanine--D-glutamate ligase [Hominifimenecus microfluidus]